MNKKFKFFLVKTVGCAPFRQRTKNLTIEAADTPAALHQIEQDYPNWQVSMFWPVWP